MIFWNEDDFTPRVDTLWHDFPATPDRSILPVEHPERFLAGDIVRVGADDLEDTGEMDEWGNPIMRALNEAVLVAVVNDWVYVDREHGANPAQLVAAGSPVTIIGSVRASSDGFSEVRSR